jgi:hypothetical protein
MICEKDQQCRGWEKTGLWAEACDESGFGFGSEEWLLKNI